MKSPFPEHNPFSKILDVASGNWTDDFVEITRDGFRSVMTEGKALLEIIRDRKTAKWIFLAADNEKDKAVARLEEVMSAAKIAGFTFGRRYVTEMFDLESMGHGPMWYLVKVYGNLRDPGDAIEWDFFFR